MTRSIQKALVALITTAQIGLVASANLDNCASFSTDGMAGSTFTRHRFYDFRNISRLDGPSPDAYDQHALSRTVGDYWRSDWTITSRQKNSAHESGAPMLYSPDSIYIGTFSLLFPLFLYSIFLDLNILWEN
jgi:hypothetical protein